MKCRLPILFLVFLMACTGARASMPVPAASSERLAYFATCAGRLSALRQHQWLVDGPASEETGRRLRQFEALIAAILPDDTRLARDLRARRINAKAAQAAILQTATFARDPRRAAAARRLAAAHLGACDGLLLS